jgi:thiamine-phosphate pyrophosphorylase
MVDFRLLLITDRAVSTPRPLEAFIRTACRAGVRAVQLREKDLDSRSLLETALELRDITTGMEARLLINDRVDIALAARADGIHRPENGLALEDARRVLGAAAIIGASTHSVDGAREAADAGADYITFGPVFETPSKMKYGPPKGLDALGEAAAAAAVPVFALGGVTPDRTSDCIRAGAAGVAVISAIAGAEDIRRAVGDFKEALGSL